MYGVPSIQYKGFRVTATRMYLTKGNRRVLGYYISKALASETALWKFYFVTFLQEFTKVGYEYSQ